MYGILAKTIPLIFQQSLGFLFIKQIHYYLILGPNDQNVQKLHIHVGFLGTILAHPILK